jgi:hypothetical protein
MSEHPILFNGEMVRAILDGRKTQTRRPIRHKLNECPSDWKVAVPMGDGTFIFWTTDGPGLNEFTAKAYPNGGGVRPSYGIGDHLWVREGIERRHGILTGGLDGLSGALYLATRTAVMGPGPAGSYVNGRALVDWKWKHDSLPAMHMPRWASRITLEVTDVRAERVQNITEEDAIAEDAFRWLSAKNGRANDIAQDAAIRWTKRLNQNAREVSDRGLFAAMWDSIYAKRGMGWEANPWIFAITFKRLVTDAT